MGEAVDFLGRLLIAAPFLFSAAQKTLRPGAALSEVRALAAGLGWAPPALVLAVVIVAQALGGLALLYPPTAAAGALALLVFLLPVTLIVHRFWRAPLERRQAVRDHFLSNMAIAGGLLIVFGGGFK